MVRHAEALRAWGGALACAGVVMTLDQITKQAAVAIVEPGHPREIIFGVELANVRNRGEAAETFADVLDLKHAAVPPDVCGGNGPQAPSSRRGGSPA